MTPKPHQVALIRTRTGTSRRSPLPTESPEPKLPVLTRLAPDHHVDILKTFWLKENSITESKMTAFFRLFWTPAAH